MLKGWLGRSIKDMDGEVERWLDMGEQRGDIGFKISGHEAVIRVLGVGEHDDMGRKGLLRGIEV